MARILIVEDEADVRILSKSLLELLGHVVDEVSSGERAVMRVRTHRYDFVLSDIGLPNMDGWGVARMVKQLSPQTRVGIVSGWTVTPRTEELAALGVDFVLPKPFSLDEIEAAIAPFLESPAEQSNDAPS